MKKYNRNYNRYLLAGALCAAGVASAAMITVPAFAYRGNASQMGPGYSTERHEAMQKAFENNDYEAWKSLMEGRGRAKDVINKDNFARFAEMHRLMNEGKTDEANKIRAELGLGQGRMGDGQRGKGLGRGNGNCGCQQNQETN